MLIKERNKAQHCLLEQFLNHTHTGLLHLSVCFVLLPIHLALMIESEEGYLLKLVSVWQTAPDSQVTAGNASIPDGPEPCCGKCLNWMNKQVLWELNNCMLKCFIASFPSGSLSRNCLHIKNCSPTLRSTAHYTGVSVLRFPTTFERGGER